MACDSFCHLSDFPTGNEYAHEESPASPICGSVSRPIMTYPKCGKTRSALRATSELHRVAPSSTLASRRVSGTQPPIAQPLTLGSLVVSPKYQDRTSCAPRLRGLRRINDPVQADPIFPPPCFSRPCFSPHHRATLLHPIVDGIRPSSR